MRVITLHPRLFDQHCKQLADNVVAGTPGGYDDAIAIRRGGAWVAEAMQRHLPEGYLGRLHDVSLHRRFTATKYKQPTASMLRHLPRPLANVLRMGESWLGSLKSRVIGTKVPDFKLEQPLKGRHVLIIDDSIDSGATVQAILNALPRDAQVDVAVITVTRSRTLVQPRFALYRQGTLVRFPWSTDFRPRRGEEEAAHSPQ